MTITEIGVPFASSGDSLVPLVHYIPVDKIGMVQERLPQMLAELLGAASSADADDYTPPFNANHGPKDAWALPGWSESDAPAAAWILSRLIDPQRRIIVHLVAAGTEGVWTAHLHKSAGYAVNVRMSGPFKAIAGRCRSAGLRPLWNGGVKAPGKGQLLTIGDPLVRSIFAAAIKEHHPALAAEFGI